MSPRLKEKYEDKVKAELIEQFNLENVMQVGKPVKVVVNMGVGEAVEMRRLSMVLLPTSRRLQVRSRASTAPRSPLPSSSFARARQSVRP